MKLSHAFIAVVALVVLLAAAWGLTRQGLPVDVAPVANEPIREYVDERGVTRLPQTHLISMPYDGLIAPIELAENAPVTAGQVVAQVVPVDLELRVAAAQAAVERLEASIQENDDSTVEATSLKQAFEFVQSMEDTVAAAAQRVVAGEAKLDFATQQLARVRELFRAGGARTQEQLDAAELEEVQSSVDYQQDRLVHSALQSMETATRLVPTMIQQYIDRKRLARAVLEKELAQAIAERDLAVQQQQRGRLVSPVEGIVLRRLESNERRVAGGTVLLEIGQLELLEVEADLLSEDVVRVRLDDRVEIGGPAIGLQAIAGRVVRIDPSGFTKVSSLGVEQQRAKIIVQFAPDELAALRTSRDLGVGFRVQLRVITEEKSAALVVPRAALFRGPTGDWRVFAVRDSRARLIQVELGLLNDEQAEIVSGLTAEDVVVLAPESSLADGALVQPILPAE